MYRNDPNELIDDLRKVKEELLTNGWCQGSVQHKGAHCTVGAINVVITGSAFDHAIGQRGNDITQAIRDIVCSKPAESSLGIATWNDAKARNIDEVIAVLDTAILNCETCQTQNTASIAIVA